MDLQNELIESSKAKRQKGGWTASVASVVTHALLVGTIIVAGATAKHSVAAEDKPIRAFITQGAAPPPPPPPPPPPAASSSAPRRATPKIDAVQPKPVTPVNPMTPPVEIPREVPKVQPLTPSTGNEETNDEPSSGADVGAVEGGVEGGVVGGVAGGVQGGVVGGEVGGVVGGEIGGVKGGVVGGVVGGQVGGTGTGTEGTGTGGKEAPVAEPEPPPAPPEPPAGPMRVGGDVSAPTVANRVNPEYTEPARRAKVTGVVVVEAVIDKNGNVDRVRIVRDLPMGLGEAAVRAVKQWKFKPGRYGGQPVDVIFNLTVNFTLNE